MPEVSTVILEDKLTYVDGEDGSLITKYCKWVKRAEGKFALHMSPKKNRKKPGQITIYIDDDNLCGVETGHLVTPQSNCCRMHKLLARIKPTTKQYLAIILNDRTLIFQAEVKTLKEIKKINEWKTQIKSSFGIKGKWNATYKGQMGFLHVNQHAISFTTTNPNEPPKVKSKWLYKEIINSALKKQARSVSIKCKGRESAEFRTPRIQDAEKLHEVLQGFITPLRVKITPGTIHPWQNISVDEPATPGTRQTAECDRVRKAIVPQRGPALPPGVAPPSPVTASPVCPSPPPPIVPPLYKHPTPPPTPSTSSAPSSPDTPLFESPVCPSQRRIDFRKSRFKTFQSVEGLDQIGLEEEDENKNVKMDDAVNSNLSSLLRDWFKQDVTLITRTTSQPAMPSFMSSSDESINEHLPFPYSTFMRQDSYSAKQTAMKLRRSKSDVEFQTRSVRNSSTEEFDLVDEFKLHRKACGSVYGPVRQKKISQSRTNSHLLSALYMNTADIKKIRTPLSIMRDSSIYAAGNESIAEDDSDYYGPNIKFLDMIRFGQLDTIDDLLLLSKRGRRTIGWLLFKPRSGDYFMDQDWNALAENIGFDIGITNTISRYLNNAPPLERFTGGELVLKFWEFVDENDIQLERSINSCTPENLIMALDRMDNEDLLVKVKKMYEKKLRQHRRCSLLACNLCDVRKYIDM